MSHNRTESLKVAFSVQRLQVQAEGKHSVVSLSSDSPIKYISFSVWNFSVNYLVDQACILTIVNYLKNSLW